MNSLKFIFIFCLLIDITSAKELFAWQGNLYKKIKEYEKVHKDFFSKVCTPGTDFKYKKLLKNYRSQGHYLPVIGEDIDRDAIKKNLYLFPKKLKHIRSIQKKLKKNKKLPDFDKVSKEIKESLDTLLKLKKEYVTASERKKKVVIKADSQKRLLLLKKQFNDLMNDIYFFKSFNYPNDHLANRFSYENNKTGKKENAKKRANRIFFYRKLVEDGAYEKNNTRGDLYTRTTLDTLYHMIQKETDFISENVRHDLEWSLRVVGRFVKRGYKKQVSRIDEWYKRTKDKYEFYKNIIKAKSKKRAQKIVQNKNKASIELKNFTYKKQAEVYKYWLAKSRLMKSLFVLETILYNEVGTVDQPDGLERADVAHIVMNRVQDPVYSNLASWQQIVEELGMSKKEYSEQKWLNTLFRVGEFSFTYHYISSSSKIYCPDMSRRGRRLRADNLKISLKALKSPRDNYKVFRYFSRISMLGKVDMTTVWKDYVAVPEKPGLLADNQKYLRKLYKENNYDLYYQFVDSRNRDFRVLFMDNATYSMTFKRGRPVFYKNRNVHLFKYFSKK